MAAITTALKSFFTTTTDALQPPERTSEFLHCAADGVAQYFTALNHVDFADTSTHTSTDAIARDIAAGLQRINTAKLSASDIIAALCTHPRGPVYKYFDSGITDAAVIANAHNDAVNYTRLREYLAHHAPFEALRMCIIDTCCNTVLAAIITHFNTEFHTNPIDCPWGLHRRALSTQYAA